MSETKPEISGASIVFLGSFNPQIFQPAWFAAQNLIRAEEAEHSKIEIVHPQYTSFTLDWLNFNVSQERLMMTTLSEAHYDPLRDLAVGTFRLLSHTPINKMGLNLEMHFKMDSRDRLDALGYRLVPQANWDSFLKKPGMLSLTVRGQREDGLSGFIDVTVQPSTRVEFGVYIRVTDHYESKAGTQSGGCDEMIGILQGAWGESLRKSKNIVSALLNMGAGK